MSMKLKRLLFASLTGAAMLLGGCAADIYSAPKPPMTAGPALWVAADADTTIYLFGTVHALPQGKDWYDDRIARAFTASDELVTEIDVAAGASSGQALAVAGLLPEGQSLRSLMAPDSRRKYEEALVTLGMPVEALDRTEPWFAAVSLSLLPLLRSGYQPDSGVEMALGARAEGKTRSALESVQDQVDLFDRMPMEAQLAFLDETVAAVPKAVATLDAMVVEWLEGDAKQLAALMNAEMADPELYDRLLVQRNARWAAWIAERMERPGTVFVAVGAGHLAGRSSVQDQLRQRGLKVRRIWE
jgi:uncharacterized protein YbaP (TraB family)